MPECHNCPHDGKGSSECITCVGPSNNNNKGQVFVSADLVFNLIKPPPSSTPELDLNECCCDAVRRLMSVFIKMNDIDRTLVFYVLCGGTPTAWAKERNVTKQSAFARIKRLINNHPSLTSILVKEKS